MAVCGAHYATWIGEDDKGDREYTLDCLDEDGQRYIVHSSDLIEAVYELSVLVGVEWENGDLVSDPHAKDVLRRINRPY